MQAWWPGGVPLIQALLAPLCRNAAPAWLGRRSRAVPCAWPSSRSSHACPATCFPIGGLLDAHIGCSSLVHDSLKRQLSFEGPHCASVTYCSAAAAGQRSISRTRLVNSSKSCNPHSTRRVPVQPASKQQLGLFNPGRLLGMPLVRLRAGHLVPHGASSIHTAAYPCPVYVWVAHNAQSEDIQLHSQYQSGHDLLSYHPWLRCKSNNSWVRGG